MSVYLPVSADHNPRPDLKAWEARTQWIVSDLPSCPLSALRRYHRHDRDHRCMMQHPRAFDHLYRLRQDERRALLTMPYDFGPEAAAELSEWCKAHEATWWTAGTGWWHPWTTAIVIMNEGPRT